VDHAEPPWFDLEEHIREVLLLAPGAAWAQKRWPAHAFSSVGLAWDGPVAVLGGPGEEDLVNAVARGCGAAFAWAGHGFDPIWDVLSRTAVAVAGDSGWMHLAGAAGARVVGLFGPTDPTDGFFVYPGVAIGRTDLACRPCALHRVTHCMRGDHACMEGIPAHQVMEAVRRCAGSS
jgi:ADP-heptose:LPS heptosyltransferase